MAAFGMFARAGQRLQVRKVGGREDGCYSSALPSAFYIDGAYPGMAVWAAQHGHVEHVRRSNVIDITTSLPG